MCLIKETVQVENLPISVLGYKGFCSGDERLLSPVFGVLTNKYKTNIGKVVMGDPREFKSRYGYKCGFHISFSKKKAESWAWPDGNTLPVVGWGITAIGFQEKRHGKFYEKTYVARYMRVFDAVDEAKKFKKQLDARLKKRDIVCA